MAFYRYDSLYKSFIKQRSTLFSIYSVGCSSGLALSYRLVFLAFMCVFGFILATSNGPGQRHGISVTRIFLPAKCGRMAQNAEKIGYQGISRLNCSGMTNIEACRSTAWCVQCTLYTGEARTNVHVHVINLRTAAFHFTMLRPTFWPNSWRNALLSCAPTRGIEYAAECILERVRCFESNFPSSD